MDSQHIDTIFLRNPPFVNKETQRRLSEIHIGIIGCGLSSQIALVLARIGVRKFSSVGWVAVFLATQHVNGSDSFYSLLFLHEF